MSTHKEEEYQSLESDQTTNNKDLPCLIFLHYPHQDLSNITNRFASRFRLLDPLLPSSFSIDDANSSRVLLCFGLITVDLHTLDRYPSIECVIGTSVGIDHIDIGECKRRGIRVTNAGDAFSEDVADYAIGLLIDVLRGLSASNRFIRAGLWSVKGEDYLLGHRLRGKHIGIIGFGKIGSRIAARLEAFGCIIAYTSRSEKPNTSNYTYFQNVEDLAQKCNVIIACCSLTDQTHHIINREIMMLLGKEGVVINVGRGSLIDENALVHALVNGELGGAGLDVYEEEPKVPRQLFVLDNVVLSPHSSVLTPEAIDSVWNVVIENIDAFFANKPLKSEVFYNH